MSIVLTDYFNQHSIANTIAVSGLLHTVQIGLFINDVNPQHNTDISQLDEPTYASYARQSVTWEAAYQQPDGSFAVSSQLVQFQMSNSLLPQSTIYGYFVCLTTSGTPLLYLEKFPSPQTLDTSLDSILLSTQYVVGGTDDGDATLVV